MGIDIHGHWDLPKSTLTLWYTDASLFCGWQVDFVHTPDPLGLPYVQPRQQDAGEGKPPTTRLHRARSAVPSPIGMVIRKEQVTAAEVKRPHGFSLCVSVTAESGAWSVLPLPSVPTIHRVGVVLASAGRTDVRQ